MNQAARRVRLLAGVCAAGSVAIAIALGWGRPAWWAAPLVALAVTVGEVAVVHLTFGRQQWALSMTDSVIAAALVLAGGSWVIPAVALGVLAAQVVRHRPRLKAEFNVAQFAIAIAFASEVTHALGGGVMGAVAGMAVFSITNYVLVAAAVALTSRRTFSELLISSAAFSIVHSAGNASIGVLAAWLALHAPVGLLGLAAPLGLMWNAYEQETRRAAEARLFAEFARGQERASGRSVDVAAHALLAAVARIFGADVEMLLLGGEGVVRYSGDEDDVRRQRTESLAFDEPWAISALGGGGVVTGVEDGRPYLAAVVGEVGAPTAVLRARRPEGAATYQRTEVTLATLLARQAATWLSVAELTRSRDEARAQAEAAEGAARALGDLGADTAPALVLLRESAARLARLAGGPGDPDNVGEIVDELHAVERAVASLLGAIALAAEPDLRTDPADVVIPEQVRHQQEWTTTGLFPVEARLP